MKPLFYTLRATILTHSVNAQNLSQLPNLSTYKLTGTCNLSFLNGAKPMAQAIFDDVVLYPNPFVVVTPRGYTNHYYAGSERIASRVGNRCWSIKPTAEWEKPAPEFDALEDFEGLSHEIYPFGVKADFNMPTTNTTPIYGYEEKVQYSCTPIELPGIELLYQTDMLKSTINCEYSGQGEAPAYYYHSDHLGSTSWVTDFKGNEHQFLAYLPYGEPLLDVHFEHYDSRYGQDDARYKFTGKERDWETGYDYMEQRYYWWPGGFWLRPDPLMDDFLELSPYVYCHGNPLKYVDPNGEADYYDIDGNHLCNDGVADNRVFQQSSKGDVVLGGYATPFSYVGDVDNISLSYDGEMISDSQSEGILTVTQHVGDKEFNQTFSAVSGNRTAYTLQNGEYSCSSFRYRSSSEAHGGYYNNGYGFSINLNPSFKTMRTDLRIHPDGGAQGTLGCIGLTGGASELKQFVRTVTPFVPADPKNTSILLTVVVTGNPGCFKPADKTGPALFR